jgi:hypothetical protein
MQESDAPTVQLMARLIEQHYMEESELLVTAFELVMEEMQKRGVNMMPNIGSPSGRARTVAVADNTENEEPPSVMEEMQKVDVNVMPNIENTEKNKLSGSIEKRHPSGRARTSVDNTENVEPPTTARKKKGKKKFSKKAPNSASKMVVPKNSIRVKVISCSCTSKCNCHIGEVFIVAPPLKSDPNGQVCRIGRSRGTTYKKYGISLYKDDEVSTKHANLFRDKEGFWIMDMHSSNGTRAYQKGYLTDEESEAQEYENLEPMVPYKLTKGLEIGIGGSILKFTW